MEPKRIRESELRRWAELVLPWLPPPDLAAAAASCKTLRHIAASINAGRSADAVRRLERYPVPFINPIDSKPYAYFLYSPSPVLRFPSSQAWGGGADKPVLGSSSVLDLGSLAVGSGFGCECEGCEPGNCPCSDGKAEVLGDSGGGLGLVRECGVACRCGSECRNRVTQKGVSVRLKVVKDKNKGWGLHADQFVSKGTFICEYAGEFLTTEEARKRQRLYDELASSHKFSPALLVVREHLPSGKACLRVNIDATKVGNVARFINHSCDGGNLLAVLVRNSGLLLPRLCFFAATDLLQDQELTFSYGDARIRQNGLPCYCGTAACFGALPSEET